LKRLQGAEDRRFHPVPLYLVLLPMLVFASQMALVAPATRWSRDRGMANADEFIADIEQHHARHGRYPVSLQAQYGDYDPHVVAVGRYVKVPRGVCSNLSFVPPRFLRQDTGTRVSVVFNPRGEHRVYSHTSWLLSPSNAAEPIQGWYASGQTGKAYWMYFL